MGVIDDWLFMEMKRVWLDKVSNVIYNNVPRDKEKNKNLLPRKKGPEQRRRDVCI